MPRYRSYKGKYTPQNPEKYVGDPKNIIYRSLLERRFMVFCDTNPSVMRYASEEFFIPYLSPVDNRIHRYFPDFYIEVQKADGSIDKIVIEVKPSKETKPPKLNKRKTQRYLNESKTFAVNTAKWDAARQFCEKKGFKFQILTEKELRPGK
jgi:hypothetical protein